MNIELVAIGKTDSAEVRALVDGYARRIGFYTGFSLVIIPDLKGAGKISREVQKNLEGEAILRQVSPGDYIVLLDDKGTEYTSEEFAQWLQKRMNSGVKTLKFVIGGAYGFSDAVYARADERLSLSRMTFSHQIVRAIFAEQLYRAFTILGNEPYHHA